MGVTIKSTHVTELLIVYLPSSSMVHVLEGRIESTRLKMKEFCPVTNPSRWHSDSLLAVACGDLALEDHHSQSSQPEALGGTTMMELPKAWLYAAYRDQLTPLLFPSLAQEGWNSSPS